MAMFEAIKRGDTEAVRDLISKGAAVNVKDAAGLTPVVAAFMSDNIDVLEVLARAGADLNATLPDHHDLPMLHYATIIENIQMIIVLLAEGADVNFRDANSGTALHIAASLSKNDSYLNICKLLLDKGADIDALDVEGDPPFNILCHNEHKNLELAQLFLNHHCKYLTNVNGFTALHFATAKNHFQLVERLVPHFEADVNAKTNRGQSALHIVAANSKVDSHLRVAELFLENQASIDAQDEDGNSPLHVLAINLSENSRLAQLFFKHKAYVNAKAKDGVTPLHNAAIMNNVRMAELLLSHGAAPNGEYDNGKTALYKALGMSKNDSHLELVKLLLKNKADVNLTDNEGKSALMVINYKNNNCAIVRELIRAGANVNAANNNMMRPLHYLALEVDDRNLEVVKLILSRVENVDPIDHQDSTPLLLLVYRICENGVDALDILRLFLKYKAQVGHPNRWSPISIALGALNTKPDPRIARVVTMMRDSQSDGCWHKFLKFFK